MTLLAFYVIEWFIIIPIVWDNSRLSIHGIIGPYCKESWFCCMLKQRRRPRWYIFYKKISLAFWHYCSKWWDWSYEIIGLLTLMYKFMKLAMWHYCTKWWDWPCDIIVQSEETGLVALLYQVMMRLTLWHFHVKSFETGLVTLLYKVM